jgi:hypothetical protein
MIFTLLTNLAGKTLCLKIIIKKKELAQNLVIFLAHKIMTPSGFLAVVSFI